MLKIPRGFLDGGAGLSKGHPFPVKGGSLILTDLLESIHSVFSSASDVEALPLEALNGTILIDETPFIWVPTSLANDATKQLAIRPTAIDASDPGRFELLSRSAAISMPVTYQTANNATLFTVPAGFRLYVDRLYYRVTTTFVNAAGRVGASSSNAAYATAGDLIGGAGGDAAAALTQGVRGGTLGTAFGSNGVVELVAGDTIKWNVIVPGYTAGEAELIAIATRT